MRVNQDKFRELILYLSEKSKEDKTFGATKLNKLLYFCDFLSYVELGHPFTGVKYFRLGNGSAPRVLRPVRQEMEQDGILKVKKKPLANGNDQIRTINLRPPKMSDFSPADLRIIDSLVEKLKVERPGCRSSECFEPSGGRLDCHEGKRRHSIQLRLYLE